MKLATLKIDNAERLAVSLDSDHLVLAADLSTNAPATLQEFIEADGEQVKDLSNLLAEYDGATISTADRLLEWMAPQPRPSKILGVAFNNIALRKTAHKDPGVPNFFLVAPSAIIAHGETIVVEPHYGHTIPEPELAAIIGKKAKNISEDAVASHIFGYTIVNDVTSHGLKFGMDSIATTREPDLIHPHHLAWRNLHSEDDRDVYFVYHGRSKSCDTFSPIGPYVTTADEIENPNRLGIRAWFNDEQFSEDSTASYTYSVETCIAEASRYFTLMPGDIVQFGTAAKGVGQFPRAHRNINLHEMSGSVSIEIDQIGKLTNRVAHSF